MATETFAVVGMTCQHCIDSVSGEVGRLAGVAAVDVDLDAGTVTVTSAGPLERDAVRGAVDEAGFDMGPDAEVDR